MLNGLVVLLCFFVLPGILLVHGIEAVISYRLVERAAQKRRILSESLDQLAIFSRNDRFAHYLLRSLCFNPDGELKELNTLPDALARLKKMFPGSFSFVVADKNGKIQPELSDEKSFAYLYRQAFNLIKDLEKAGKSQQSLSDIAGLEQKLSRLRPLLGEQLRQEDLLQPLRMSSSGSSILVSGGKGRFHLWFGNGRDFQIIVYISRDFIRSRKGLFWGIDFLNRRNPEMIVGATQFPPDESSLSPLLSQKDSGRVIRAIAEAEDLRFEPEIAVDDSGYIATRFFNVFDRGFAFFRPEQKRDDYSARIYANLLKFFLSAALIGYVYLKVHPVSFTIKLKTLAFFAYAVFLPLLAVGSLISQYLDQIENELLNELKAKSQRIIEKIDLDYAFYKADLAKMLEKGFEDFYSRRILTLSEESGFKKFYETIFQIAGQEEFILVDSHGKDYMQTVSPRVLSNSAMVRMVCGQTLKAAISRTARILMQQNVNLYMFAHLFRRDRDIQYIGASDLEYNTFKHVWIRDDYDEGFYSLLVWKESSLNHRFLREKITGFPQEDALVFTFCKENERFINAPAREDPYLENLMKEAAYHKSVIFRRLNLENRSYLATAMPVKNLKQTIFVVLFPLAPVLHKLQMTKLGVGGFTSFLLLLSFSTFFLLRHLLFKPLDELKVGIDRFAARDFQHSLNIVCRNEMGNMLQTFNDSFETLQSLEVARIVQDSILCEPELCQNRVEVAAKTVVASKLGGDFFDLVELDKERILVFIGDATGHGVPAALSMAMAKAVMIHEGKNGLDKNALMLTFHRLFRRLKEQGSRDFMTCTCVEVNTGSGETEIINFGHPYPVLLEKRSGAVKYLSGCRDLPPGFGKDRHCKIFKLGLESGDRLILYTDGLVESVNENGEALGFDNFAEILRNSSEMNLKEGMEYLFNTIQVREKSGADDKTLIVIQKS